MAILDALARALAATNSSLCRLRPTRHTTAPCAARLNTMAFPIPLLAPVTTAVWLLNVITLNDVSANVSVGSLGNNLEYLFRDYAITYLVVVTKSPKGEEFHRIAFTLKCCMNVNDRKIDLFRNV
jgi:hypothetical protein